MAEKESVTNEETPAVSEDAETATLEGVTVAEVGAVEVGEVPVAKNGTMGTSQERRTILPPEVEKVTVKEGMVFPHTGVGRLMEVVRATTVAVHYRVAGEEGSPSWVLGKTDFVNMFGPCLIDGMPLRPVPENLQPGNYNPM